MSEQETPLDADPCTSKLHTASTRTIDIITGAACFIAFLHLWAAFFPSATTWGIHHLSFFPVYVRIVVPLFMLAATIPAVQEAVLCIARQSAQYFKACPRRVQRMLFAGFIIGMAVLFWVGRERTFFLGDGSLVLRSLPNVEITRGIPLVFPNEPLAGMIIWNAYRLLSWLNIQPSDELSVRFISMIFGCGSLLLLLFISRRVSTDSFEQFLVYLFILVSGGTQLFFGYVENYAPTYFCILLFMLLSLDFLREKIHLVVPSIMFGVLFTCHFGMVVIAPGLAVLFYRELKQRNVLVAAQSFLAMVGTIVLLLWLCGYSLQSFEDVFLQPRNHLVPLFAVTKDVQSYTLLSVDHFLDVANLQLLLSPLALLTLTVVFILGLAKNSIKEPGWSFLFFVTLFGLAFTFAVNSDIGMSRDWDMLAPFTTGILVTAAFAVIHCIAEEHSRLRLLVLITCMTFLHTATWVAVNANEKASIERFEKLQDPSLWGKRALAYSYEELAIYYRDQKDLKKSIQFYNKYLEIDSTNNRIWRNAGTLYYALRNQEATVNFFEKAVQYGSADTLVYIYLGKYYGLHDRYDDAIKMLQEALLLDSASIEANDLMGSAMGVGKRDFRAALPYFLREIELDSTSAKAYFDAGICLSELREPDAMKYYWNKYLQLDPTGEHADEIRHIISSIR